MTDHAWKKGDADRRNHDEAELGVTWGTKGLKARGLGVLIILAVLAIAASNLYAGFRLETTFNGIVNKLTAEHTSIRTSQDRTSCIVAMDLKDRESFRKTYAPGAFKKWCPWVEE